MKLVNDYVIIVGYQVIIIIKHSYFFLNLKIYNFPNTTMDK